MNLTSWQKVAGQVFRDRADELRAGLEISHVGLRLEGKWTVVALVPSRPFCQHDHSATRRLVALADNDDRVETEITEPILDEHGDVRRRFVELWNERTSGDTGAVALAAAWQPVARMLESHASARVDVADQVLRKEGSNEATEGTTYENAAGQQPCLA